MADIDEWFALQEQFIQGVHEWSALRDRFLSGEAVDDALRAKTRELDNLNVLMTAWRQKRS